MTTPWRNLFEVGGRTVERVLSHLVDDEGDGYRGDIVWHGCHHERRDSWSGMALLVAAKFMPVQVVRIYWGFTTPEQYPRELMTLFWLSFRMMTTIRSSPVRVASSQGIEDSASAGTDWTHWWKDARETLVSAENGAQ